MLFFERLSWRHWPWVILILAWLAYGLANWGHGLADLHVDHIISTWFVALCLWAFIIPLKTFALADNPPYAPWFSSRM